jgi:hypothetical protein
MLQPEIKIVTDALVDKAYDAALAHEKQDAGRTSIITWDGMKVALTAVAAELHTPQKVPDTAKAKEYLERMRRLIDNCPDDYTRDNLKLIFTDVNEELSK